MKKYIIKVYEVNDCVEEYECEREEAIKKISDIFSRRIDEITGDKVTIQVNEKK